MGRVPGSSFATFDVVTLGALLAIDTGSKVSESFVKNNRDRVTINGLGYFEQIIGRVDGNTPLLAAPIRLGFLHETPEKYPAWNMDWVGRQKACQSSVDGPATIGMVESGPVRVALEITRQSHGSRFTQRVHLTAGGDSVEFPTHIDWQTPESSLEAVMPLGVSAPTATHDTQVGVSVRGINTPIKYEVPQQQWLDVTAPDNRDGVGVLNDCKYGSDKPDDKTIRLTLLYTPQVRNRFQDESTQGFGWHEMTYAITGHAGD